MYIFFKPLVLGTIILFNGLNYALDQSYFRACFRSDLHKAIKYNSASYFAELLPREIRHYQGQMAMRIEGYLPAEWAIFNRKDFLVIQWLVLHDKEVGKSRALELAVQSDTDREGYVETISLLLEHGANTYFSTTGLPILNYLNMQKESKSSYRTVCRKTIADAMALIQEHEFKKQRWSQARESWIGAVMRVASKPSYSRFNI